MLRELAAGQGPASVKAALRSSGRLDEDGMHRGLGPELLGRMLREPLLHFLLIGVALFALYRAGSPSDAARVQRLIEVTPAQMDRLGGQFEAVWRRRPTAVEREALAEDFVREEIYYREALALGLDRDDTVIRRRLRQKMEFLSDAGAGALAPDEATLRAFFEKHVDRFTPAAQVTFRQVFLGDTDAAPVLAALAEGADPGGVGSRTLLPATMSAATQASVDGTFGDGFFAAVSALEPGAWRGPVESAFGPHLVQLLEAAPEEPPSFEAVRGDVEEAWRRRSAEDLREARYRALRERYEVIVRLAP